MYCTFKLAIYYTIKPLVWSQNSNQRMDPASTINCQAFECRHWTFIARDTAWVAFFTYFPMNKTNKSRPCNVIRSPRSIRTNESLSIIIVEVQNMFVHVLGRSPSWEIIVLRFKNFTQNMRVSRMLNCCINHHNLKLWPIYGRFDPQLLSLHCFFNTTAYDSRSRGNTTPFQAMLHNHCHHLYTLQKL